MEPTETLNMIQLDQYYIVLVRFKHHESNNKSVKFNHLDYIDSKVPYSEKQYAYKVPVDKVLKLGDDIVVNSPYHGLVVVTVFNIIHNDNEKLMHCKNVKWIVDTIDADAYRERIAQEQEAVKLLQQSRIKKARDEAVEAIRIEFGDDVFKQLNASGQLASKIIEQQVNTVKDDTRYRICVPASEEGRAKYLLTAKFSSPDDAWQVLADYSGLTIETLIHAGYDVKPVV